MTKFFYRVLESDTVYGIANRFLVAPSRIIKLNGLKREVAAGDLLYIEKTDNSALYTVKPFDKLKDIASACDAQEKDILENNGVDYIFYGLILELPQK